MQIKPQWREPLAEAGLDSFDALMTFEAGRCFSWHKRGQAYRVELPGGRAVFLKRDARTKLKDIFGDCVRLQRPQPRTFKERWAAERLAELGIATPQIIAWGQKRRAGLPWQAVIVSTCLPGRPLDEYLASGIDPAGRRATLAAVGSVIAKLYEAGLSWPDLLPKHVFISPQREVGLIDLERMHPCRSALVRRMPAHYDASAGT